MMILPINSPSFYPFILCSLLFLVVIIKYFRRNAVKLNLPPGPKKLPLIGNLHQLAGPQLPHRRLSELARQYGPQVMHLQLGELSVVMISDPETAKEVLKTQDPNFAQKSQFVASEMISFDNSSLVFAPYGEYWRQMRKITILELLSAKRVRSYRSIREKEVRNIIEHISSTCGSSIVNLSQKMASYSNSVTCKSAFGEDFKTNQQEELIQLLRDTVELGGGFNLAELYPSIRIFRHLNGMQRKMHLFGEKMNNMFDDILRNHKNKRNKNIMTTNSSTSSEDLVDVFLRIQESNEMGIEITTNNIKGVIRDLFAAGTETTTVTVEWAMSEMLRNPTVMNKVQAEVREALKGKTHIEESDVEGLKYLKLVIKETLRLHPAGPLFPREARDNCKINGYDVPVNTKVLINIWAIGRDPKYWSDPEKFNPERFLDSPVDFNGSHFQFLPFGSGKRMCPGIIFANASMELLLAALLYHFDWKLPKGQNPQELDMDECFASTVKRKNNLCVIATKMH